MPKRPNTLLSEAWSVEFAHAAIPTTETDKLYKVPAGRKLRLDRITYINPTGLVGDNTNAFSMQIKNAATLVSLVFNTDTDDVPAGASLAADTFIDQAPTVPTAAVFAAGDIVSVVITEDGASTLPAGRLKLEGRLF